MWGTCHHPRKKVYTAEAWKTRGNSTGTLGWFAKRKELFIDTRWVSGYGDLCLGPQHSEEGPVQGV